MPKHTIDAPNNNLETAPDWNHEDLTTLYPTPGVLNSNPISTDAEKEARRAAERQADVRKIRKNVFTIGLNIVFPFILGLFTIQHVIAQIPLLSPGDLGGAMFVVFTSFAAVIATGASAFLGLRYLTNEFYFHNLKAWPVIVTVLAWLVTGTVILQPITNSLLGGWIGYIASLLSLLVLSIIMSALLTFIWSSRLFAKIKIFIICDIAIVAVGLFILALLHPSI